jgi:protein-tyrosine phosphatase
VTDVTLVRLEPGALALTHRPKMRDLPALRAEGVTHLVTLLAANEGAEQIGEAAQRAGLEWIWLPLVGAAVPDLARDDELRDALRHICELVNAGSQVVVHCSAGIHRTGMVGYAILRQFGLDTAAARAMLAVLRTITADGVGDDRLAWGDRLAEPHQTPAPRPSPE